MGEGGAGPPLLEAEVKKRLPHFPTSRKKGKNKVTSSPSYQMKNSSWRGKIIHCLHHKEKRKREGAFLISDRKTRGRTFFLQVGRGKHLDLSRKERA